MKRKIEVVREIREIKGDKRRKKDCVEVRKDELVKKEERERGSRARK